MFWVYILQNPLGQFYIGRTALATGRFPFHGIIFTYDNVKGIVQVAQDGTKYVQLATGKTKPSDAVLDDFRLLRTTVNKAPSTVASLHITWTALGKPGFPPSAPRVRQP